jgi:C-terminal processing protease CtpA/Prc
VAQVGCVHTSLRVPATIWEQLPDNFFPVQLRFVHNKAYLIHFLNDTQDVQPGSELISINDIPVPEIIATLKQTISADGYNDSFRTERLNMLFHDSYALQYGFPEKYTITFKLPDYIKPQQTTLIPVTRQVIRNYSAQQNNQTSTGDPALDFKILTSKNTAVLTIKSFNYYQAQEREKFYSFIDTAFVQIQKVHISNLILDLRDNDGGDPFCSTHLLSYLEQKPIPYFARVYPDGYEHFAEPIPLAENNYKGKLYILINGKGVSTLGHIGAILKHHRIGIFIGSETGATFECNDATKRITLKNTGLNLHVARITFTAAVKDMARKSGILPDYPVQPSIEDIINNRDTVLEYTFQLIEKSRREK